MGSSETTGDGTDVVLGMCVTYGRPPNISPAAEGFPVHLPQHVMFKHMEVSASITEYLKGSDLTVYSSTASVA